MERIIAPKVIKLKGIFVSKYKLEVWGYAVSLFLFTMPYFVWNTPFNISPILLLLCLTFSCRHIKVSHKTLIPVAIIILCYVFISLRGESNFMGIVTILLISHFFLLNGKFISDVFNTYLIIFSMSIIPSLIVYVLVIIFGFELPNNTIEGLNSIKQGTYYQYPFLIIYEEFGFVIPRFFGYYDEPGVVGTIAAVLLSVRNFNLKDKYNIPIFIAGILSLSFFFIIIFVVYTVVFLKLKYKILIFGLLTFFIFYFYLNEFLYEFVFKRFEIIDGAFSGDNRIADIYFDDWYMKFQNSTSYFFGLGSGSNIIYNFGGSSYKDLIINYGIVFYILYTSSFIFLTIKKIKISKELFICSLIFFSVLYQRPMIDNIAYVFLLFAPIFVLSNDYKNTLVNE